MTVESWASRLPQYVIEKTKITIGKEQTAKLMDALEEEFRDAKSSRLDGLRLD